MAESTWPSTPSNSAEAFCEVLGLLNNNTGYVIPNYLSNLEVTSTGAGNGNVFVLSGAAVVANANATDKFYINDATVTVAFTAAVNNRIDRIVVRNCRIAKIVGVEAATPAMPALTGSDLPLAWVYIPAGYNPVTTVIQPYYIHDERMFADMGAEPVEFDNLTNLMHNFEFMAFARGGLTTTPPELWTTTGAITACAPDETITSARNFSTRSRGVALTTPGAGLVTTIPLNRSGVQTLTIRFNWQKTADPYNVVTIQNQILGGAAGTSKVVRLPWISGDPNMDEIIRFTTDGTSDAIRIMFWSSAASSIIISPIIVTEGLCTTYNYPQKSEIIMFDRTLQDASWTATPKSSGTTSINLRTSFAGLTCQGTLAVLTRVEANDSGSAATNPASLAVSGALGYPATIASIAHVGLLPNDYRRSVMGIIPVAYNNFDRRIQAVVTASGANTLDATIEIIGVIV